eukprot:364906-Chlamydomonas_euryale.AAC.20
MEQTVARQGYVRRWPVRGGAGSGQAVIEQTEARKGESKRWPGRDRADGGQAGIEQTVAVKGRSRQRQSLRGLCPILSTVLRLVTPLALCDLHQSYARPWCLCKIGWMHGCTCASMRSED